MADLRQAHILNAMRCAEEHPALETARDDFDHPWKEIIELFFSGFMAFFFPEADADIDWERGAEFLDKELQYAIGVAGGGSPSVDKLVKVWRRNGAETWLLAHVEVQNQALADFPWRVHVYHSAIFAHFRCCVVTLVILGDARRGWRPHSSEYGAWGGRSLLEFPIAKLLDYEDRWEELEASGNPFAPVVMAHLKTIATQGDPQSRYEWKIRILRWLHREGLDLQDFRNLFRFIDWLMRLPVELDERCIADIRRYEEETNMPWMSPFEQRTFDRGIAHGSLQAAREAVIEAVHLRFPNAAATLDEAVMELDDAALLRELLRKAITATSLEEFEQALPSLSVVR
ncbi:MAG: transposase [Armatimonadetes bacterium CG_4_10_14_3_um_filter_66_18]|nr:transposase [Armatimonadota bacterium]NCQ28498.1 transposase [Armatimonadota bacterium]PIY54019.1 MAG: transposase [Armatimonadetes bacterium CG_4_10_14_3_um_filter_66_18]